MAGTPYLSIVAASRNDNHGGDALKRMTMFVNGLIAQTNRHKLPAELIMVEWNPPEDKPLLHTALPRPREADYLILRYVIVPKAIHQRFRLAREIPLYQMIAKNVGIRRAQGEFILCTNIDLLFSHDLFKILAARNLRHDTYYRANRCDVPDNFSPAWNVDQQLEWCEKNVIRRLGRDRRFRNINPELVGLMGAPYPIKWIFDKAASALKLFWPEERSKYYQADCFACGDFTLMAKKAWFDIEGYLELDFHALHIDTLGILAAMALGYRQHVLPPNACTYHIEHAEGWTTMNPIEKLGFLKERPSIDYGLVYELGEHFLKNRKTYNLNPDTWGFSDLTFEEHIFSTFEVE